MDWYDSLEDGIRAEVRLLRDNGFNTTCSCGHKRSIQIHMCPSDAWQLKNLLFNEGYRHFTITAHTRCDDSHYETDWTEVVFDGERVYKEAPCPKE